MGEDEDDERRYHRGANEETQLGMDVDDGAEEDEEEDVVMGGEEGNGEVLGEDGEIIE